MIPTNVFWMSALVPLVGACVGTDPNTKCQVTKVSGLWYDYVEDIDVQDPNRCPFLIDQGRTKLQSFYGVVTAVYPGGLGAGDYMETRVFNSLLRNVGTADDFSDFRGLPPKAEGSVTYTAGTGSSATATTGYDEAINVLRDFGGGNRGEGDVTLSISYNVNANIVAPTYITGGSWIQVSASAANHRTPLKYTWWRNGTLMGVTGSSFGTYGPAAGSSVTYKVQITDADGDKGADTHAISANTSSGGGGGGGGCVVLENPTTGGATPPSDNRVACPIPP